MKVILCPGVGDKGMLQGLVRHLPAGTEVVTLPARSYGPVPLPFGDDFEASVATGEWLLRIELNKGPAFVAAYSAYAAAAGNITRDGHKNLLGTGLVADPFQPRRVTAFVNSSYGIAGSRDITGGAPVKWVFDPKDVICQCDQNSPLRILADATSKMSLKRPDAWVADLLNRLTTRRWQQVMVNWRDRDAVRARYDRAFNDAWGYLPGGRGDHVGYGTRKQPNGRTYLHNLADWMVSL